jgi:hypothetical protein
MAELLVNKQGSFSSNPPALFPLITDGGITIDGINKRSSISVIPPFFYSYPLYVHILPIRPQQRSLLLIPLNPIGINPRGNNKNNTKYHIPIQTIHKRIIL